MRTIAVICKAPIPGRVKTRLCPPCTPEQAAALAEAALDDTFAALRGARCDRRVAVLDGAPGPWLGDGIQVIAQRGAGLDERLASAFQDLGGPTLIVGMDTPQLSAQRLTAALEATVLHGAALGPAADGGYWAIGLTRPARGDVEGVPMSRSDTGAVQHQRLRDRGHRPALLEELVDVDDMAAARAVAAGAPRGRFARALAELDRVGVAA